MPTLAAFPPIDDPAAERWLAEANTLARCYSRTVHGHDPRAEAFNNVIVYTAAHSLWTSSGGRPEWHRFDARRWLEQLTRLPDGPQVIDRAAITMHAFMWFLIDKGHIAKRARLPCLQVLAPFTYAGIRQICEALEELNSLEEGVTYSVSLWPTRGGLA
jgi:hypothetical protein